MCGSTFEQSVKKGRIVARNTVAIHDNPPSKELVFDLPIGVMFQWSSNTDKVYMRTNDRYMDLTTGASYTLSSCGGCGNVTRLNKVTIERRP